MGRLCFGLTRTFLILVNFIIVFLACLLIYISFSALDQDFGMDVLNDNHPKIVHTYISAISAGVGIIIALMSILGLFGALKKSESVLAMYSAIIFFMIIILTLLVILSITVRKETAYKDIDKSIVNSTVHIYNFTNINDFRTKALDQIQKRLNCCGINSPNDWRDYGHIRKIPRSCCSNQIETSQPALFKYCEQSDYKIGCWKSMTDYLDANISSVKTFLYILNAFGLTCSVASLYMIRTIRRRFEVV